MSHLSWIASAKIEQNFYSPKFSETFFNFLFGKGWRIDNKKGFKNISNKQSGVCRDTTIRCIRHFIITTSTIYSNPFNLSISFSSTLIHSCAVLNRSRNFSFASLFLLLIGLISVSIIKFISSSVLDLLK